MAEHSGGLGVYAAAGIVALLIAGTVGWWLNNAFGSAPGVHVTVTENFVGTIRQVNLERSAGCVSGHGHDVCSVFAPLIKSSQIKVGRQVRAIHETVYTGGGNGSDLLVLYPVK